MQRLTSLTQLLVRVHRGAPISQRFYSDIKYLKFSELRPRRAGRVLILNPEDKALIFEYEHFAKKNKEEKPDALAGKGSYFLVPGGKLEVNESFYDCAVRELREETGISEELNPTVIARRWAPLLHPSGEVVCATEEYFCIKVKNVPKIDTKEWTSQEKKTIQKHHWLSLAEIERLVGKNLWPSDLPGILRAVLSESKLPVLYRSKQEKIGNLVLKMEG